jgi:hypothetical protein
MEVNSRETSSIQVGVPCYIILMTLGHLRLAVNVCYDRCQRHPVISVVHANKTFFPDGGTK